MIDSMIRTAVFSECRRYRYSLTREWGDTSKRLMVIGLNPSTADEIADDPTIRKCTGFARRWCLGAYDMANLFAWRSTDPLGLLDPAATAHAADNDEAIAAMAQSASRIVFAWGKHDPRLAAMISRRSFAVRNLVHSAARCEVGSFGRNAGGTPKHPLMLAYTTPFVVEREAIGGVQQRMPTHIV